MPRVASEPTIPVFERAKAVHASDRAATAIGPLPKQRYNFFFLLHKAQPLPSLYKMEGRFRYEVCRFHALGYLNIRVNFVQIYAVRLMYQVMCKLHIPIQEVC
jgi:hypothetical protein